MRAPRTLRPTLLLLPLLGAAGCGSNVVLDANGSSRVEVIGDAVRPEELERLLQGLDPAVLEQMLCG